MKKMTKIVLVTALVLVVAGGLMTGAGLVSGASFETFAQSTNESAFSRRVLRNIGNIVHWDDRWEHWEEKMENNMEQWGEDFEEDMEDWGDDLEDSLEHQGEELHHGIQQQQRDGKGNGSQSNLTREQTIPMDQVHNLSVEAYHGGVEIKTVAGSEIKISNLCKKDVVEYDAEDRELYIIRDCSDDDQESMIIELPEEKIFYELDLDVTNASILAQGKIQAEESSLSVESGNLSVELLDSKETDLECYSGNLSVKHTGKLADYRVELEADSCNVKLDGQPHRGYVQSIFGSRNSQKTIDVEGNSGNIEMSFENK